MSIICTNCGKSIPYIGNVCPYCNADKSKDKKSFDKTTSYVGAAFFGAIIGAIIGYQVSPGGLCLGAFLGPVVGLGICFAHLSNKKP